MTITAGHKPGSWPICAVSSRWLEKSSSREVRNVSGTKIRGGSRWLPFSPVAQLPRRAVEFGAAAAIVAPILARRRALAGAGGNPSPETWQSSGPAGPTDEPRERGEIALDAGHLDQAISHQL